jgi:photosystem II stability/assembly factor-like uncharacterized protein
VNSFRRRVLLGVAAVVVAAAVVIAVIAGRRHSSPAPGAPSATSTTAPRGLGRVSVGEISSMSFIDANEGFGVEADRYLVHTADGGQSWQRVHLLPSGDRYVRVAPYQSDFGGLIAWGDGPLSQSSDRGAHWHATLGPSVYAVSEASFQLWAGVVCGRASASPCTPRLASSADGGRTWRDPPTLLRLGTGAQAIATPSGNTVYLVDGEFAWTPDAGKSWAHAPEPAGCATRSVQHLAVQADVLLLICAPSPQLGAGTRAFVSVDQGRTWKATAPLPSQDTIPYVMVNATDSGFVVAANSGPLLVTTDRGRSWHPAFRVGPHSAVRGIDREFGIGVWVAASDQGIWFSPDGAHWEQRASA